MSFKNIQPGDRVTFVTPQGQERHGVAVPLLIFPDRVVVNTGGRHGSPAVVNERTYVRHTGRRAEPTPSEECEHGRIGACPACMRDDF